MPGLHQVQLVAEFTLQFGLSLLVGAWCVQRRWLELPMFWARTGSTLSLLGALAGLLCEAAIMGEVPLLSAGDVLQSLLTQTSYGRAWLFSSLGLLLALPWAWRSIRFDHLAAFGMFIAIYGHVLLGHAGAMGSMSLQAAIAALHGLLMAVWVGEVIIGAWQGLQIDQATAPFRAYAQAMSRNATIALAGLTATGLANLYWILTAATTALARPYQIVLIAKLCLFGLAAAMGAWNRFVCLPHLDALGSRRRCLHILRVESLILTGVLLLAVIMSNQAHHDNDF